MMRPRRGLRRLAGPIACSVILLSSLQVLDSLSAFTTGKVLVSDNFGSKQRLPASVQRHAVGEAPEASQNESIPPRSLFVQVWGAFGVVAYLGYGVNKVIPIVQDGLSSIEAPWQSALLVATLFFFGYVEGYKGFQKGFSPRVVSRAWVVAEESNAAPLWHKILAPAFCIGYFHGTKKRVITSWAVTIAIFLVVIGVKQLANPYRAIIDAGVVVGLVWGILSIIALFVQSLQKNRPPEFDPALPEDTPYCPPPKLAAEE